MDAVSVCLVLHSLSYARLVRAHDKDNMIHKPDASEIAQDKKTCNHQPPDIYHILSLFIRGSCFCLSLPIQALRTNHYHTNFLAHEGLHGVTNT